MSANFNIVDLLKRRQPRQPFDERLPDGRSVGELIAGAGQTESPAPPRQTPSPALQRTALGVPGGDVVEMLKRPAPPGMPPPPNDDRRVSEAIPPVSVGTSTAGQSPIEKQQALVDLMRSTPAGQKVRQRGDQIEVAPPEQSPSRVKNAAGWAIQGAADAGIPGAVAGFLMGLIKPGANEERLKNKHIAREEARLDSQINTEAKKAKLQDLILSPQIAIIKAQRDAEYNAARIKIQEDAEAGRISRAEAERQQKELDRKSRERIAQDQIASRERVARMRPNSETAKDEERTRKASAAQAEYDQLVSDEAEAGKQKNEAYAYLEKLKANPDIPKEDIAEATRAAEEANKIYQSFAEKKRDAQTRMRENAVTSSNAAKPYAGRTMSQANLERYAKDKGMTVEAARAKLESEDGIVIR